MGFTTNERINLATKVLAAGVIDANEVAQWYESRFLNEFTSDTHKIWSQFNELRAYPAPDLATAQNNCVGPLIGVVQDKSHFTNSVHLSPVPGTGNSTFVAMSTFNVFTSTKLDNWVQPQAVPQSNGVASIGYTVRLYNGNPNTGGVEILTTTGMTGSGSSASVAWIFNYSMGLLFLSADLRGSVNVNNLYITGFRYIGRTVADALSIDGYQSPYTYLPKQENIPVTINGQTSFQLNHIPAPGTSSDLFVNGIKMDVNDTHLVGQSIIYTGVDPIMTVDVVDVLYWVLSTDGYNSSLTYLPINEDLVITSPGQTTFTLSNIPGPDTQILLFLNGQKLALSDVSIAGQTVIYTGALPLTLVDNLSALYWCLTQGEHGTVTKRNVRYYLNATPQSTSQNTLQRIGSDVIYTDLFATANHVTFRAIIESPNPAVDGYVMLYNLTDDVFISNSILTSSATSPTEKTATLFIPTDIAAGKKIYEVYLKRVGGSSSDYVVCLSATIEAQIVELISNGSSDGDTSLQNVLAFSNTTAGHDIIVSAGDSLVSATSLLNVNSSLNVVNDGYVHGALKVYSDAYFQTNVNVNGVFSVSGTTISAHNNRITNVADPGSINDAATKGYVDSKSSSGGSIWDGYVSSTNSSTNATPIVVGSFTSVNGVSYKFDISVIARDTSGNTAVWELVGAFKNVSGILTQIGSTSIIAEEKDTSAAAWLIDFNISGTTIQILGTGSLATNINWKTIGNIIFIS